MNFGSQSGIEMALRSMGLGSVLDAAKHLADSGAVQKILHFADGLEELNERLARLEAAAGLTPWERKAGAGQLIDGTARIRGADDEPGPRANVGGGS